MDILGGLELKKEIAKIAEMEESATETKENWAKQPHDFTGFSLKKAEKIKELEYAQMNFSYSLQ